MIQKFSADGYQDELIVDVQNIFFLPLRHLVPIKIVTVQEGLSLLNHQSRQYHEFYLHNFQQADRALSLQKILGDMILHRCPDAEVYLRS